MRTPLIAFLLLGGCGSQIGTEDGFGCLVDATDPITDTTAVPDGFSETVRGMLDRVTGSFVGDVVHPDDTTDALQLTIAADGDPELEHRSWQSTGDGDGDGAETTLEALDTDCGDDVRIPVQVTLEAGTALDEQLAGAVFVGTDGTATLSLGVDAAALVGDAEPYGFTFEEMASTELRLTARTGAGTEGWSGDVQFVGTSHPTSDGPDGSVSATLDPWGTFETVRAP